MYRRTTGRITHVSDDLREVRLTIPLSYRNRNYVGSMYGGALFSAVDGILMVQLINILENQYVVWDKSAEIFYRIPVREDVFARFVFTPEDLDRIVTEAERHGEYEFEKVIELTDEARSRVFCEVHKRLYVATRAHYRAKRATGRLHQS